MEDKVTANTSPNTRWGKLEKWSTGDTVQKLELLLQGGGWCQKQHSWAEPEEPAQQFPDVLLHYQVSWTEQCNTWGTAWMWRDWRSLNSTCNVVMSFCGTWNLWYHGATGFGHITSKTCCCMRYYLEFIRLDKVHGHITTSPWVQSITSVLLICVEQLIIFYELNPFRGSAAVREGKGRESHVLLLYVLTCNPCCTLSLALESMFYDHFSLQFRYRQWQNSRKPTCPCDVPREQAEQGWWCSLPLYLILVFYPGNTGLVNALLWNADGSKNFKKSRRARTERWQLSESQV